MTGVSGGICDASITNELCSIYTTENAACWASGNPWKCCTGAGTGACTAASTCTAAPPGLFPQIAMTESSYAQFASTSANGLDGLWPSENQLSAPKGKYIGLMAVALLEAQGSTFAPSMDRAWNWLTNAQVGDDFFNQKLGNVGSAQNKAKNSKYPGLPSPSELQVENMALLQYGGYVKKAKRPNTQYYSPQLSGGQWQWLQNAHVSTAGQKYVAKVRAAQPPTATTCN
jgi:hypothetical protein